MDILTREFPEDFKFGVSLAGFQFEMGDRFHRFINTNTDWWHWVRDSENIASRLVSGDLPEHGVNYLELYRLDHELARDMGLDIYRLNVEWGRVFPHPTWLIDVDVEYDGYGLIKDVKITEETLRRLDRIANQDTIRIYRDIIYDLRVRGFKVVLNLHHFTTPYWLHDPIKARRSNLQEGPLGLLDERFPVEFAKFAAYIAWKFGDLVDMWSSFNEPIVVITMGYLMPFAGFPPGVFAPDKLPRLMSNVVLAHALAYKMIKEFDTVKVDPDSKTPAEIGIIHNISPDYPLSEQDQTAADKVSYLYNDVLLNAIVHGVLDIGLNMKDLIKPSILGGKLDWFGVNYYTRTIVKRREPGALGLLDFEIVPGYGHACVPNGTSKSNRWCSDFGWELYPEGLAKAVEIARRYSDRIYITENGVADAKDIYRPQYLINHLYVITQLIERGLPLKGYMHWALVDNYEWAQGFRMKFGLVEVNLTTKERIPRPSARIYSEIAKTKKINKEYLYKYLMLMEKF